MTNIYAFELLTLSGIIAMGSLNAITVWWHSQQPESKALLGVEQSGESVFPAGIQAGDEVGTEDTPEIKTCGGFHMPGTTNYRHPHLCWAAQHELSAGEGRIFKQFKPPYKVITKQNWFSDERVCADSSALYKYQVCPNSIW